MKPILFNTSMVQAILEGRKTVTRRVIKPQPKSRLTYICMGHKHGSWSYPGADAWKYWNDESFRLPDGLTDKDKNRYWAPPYHTDDILYVRESTRLIDFSYIDGDWSANVQYRADNVWGPRLHHLPDGENERIGWRPSIHMPREAARIFLRVTDLWVERLQDITEGGARNEGAQPVMVSTDPQNTPENERTWLEWLPALPKFIEIWDSTIKPVDRALYGWAANPWVWGIQFKRIGREEAGGDA